MACFVATKNAHRLSHLKSFVSCSIFTTLLLRFCFFIVHSQTRFPSVFRQIFCFPCYIFKVSFRKLPAIVTACYGKPMVRAVVFLVTAACSELFGQLGHLLSRVRIFIVDPASHGLRQALIELFASKPLDNAFVVPIGLCTFARRSQVTSRVTSQRLLVKVTTKVTTFTVNVTRR